jgi:hypothetical protein
MLIVLYTIDGGLKNAWSEKIGPDQFCRFDENRLVGNKKNQYLRNFENGKIEITE